VRTLALLVVLAPTLTLADVVDLSRGGRRERGEPPALVVRMEGGNEFAPFGYLGGCLSWMIDAHDVLEFGAGGGFPGLQLGLAARRLFGEGGQFLFAELFLAGNTRVNRGVDPSSRVLDAGQATSSLWTGLGFGFEQRTGFLDVSLAGNIVFTSSSLTPHWSVHGGVGFGF
jgi:hypothetical protein